MPQLNCIAGNKAKISCLVAICCINGKPTKCILDTGASKGAISLRFAQLLELYIFEYNGYSFMQYFGQTARPDGRTCVTVKLGDHENDCCLLVVNHLPVDVILSNAETSLFRI